MSTARELQAVRGKLTAMKHAMQTMNGDEKQTATEENP
jgi:hypothetical protein